MKLAKYVKFREEKFGGVLFETRSEKVFTLNPTATAVVREIQAGSDEREIPARLKARYRDDGRSHRARSAGLHRRAAAEGPGGRLTVSIPASTPAATGSGDLGAPLYIAWQVTNECNLACLHCIEESGPGKAFA
jgi:hypothetical protein